jgi:hypothetical protein
MAVGRVAAGRAALVRQALDPLLDRGIGLRVSAVAVARSAAETPNASNVQAAEIAATNLRMTAASAELGSTRRDSMALRLVS